MLIKEEVLGDIHRFALSIVNVSTNTKKLLSIPKSHKLISGFGIPWIPHSEALSATLLLTNVGSAGKQLSEHDFWPSSMSYCFQYFK